VPPPHKNIRFKGVLKVCLFMLRFINFLHSQRN